VLKKPMRRMSRLDIGKLKVIPKESVVAMIRREWLLALIVQPLTLYYTISN
jgi:hypothetical protein